MIFSRYQRLFVKIYLNFDMSTKSKVLKLYKSLLRESEKFASYNFRLYAIDRVKYGFRENKNVNDTEILRNKIAEAHKNLEIIKRQTLISQMYKTEKLVIENIAHK
ncbi:LYR motif-containing protein 4 [Sitophilus oryzae]|uniref:LYR motif-containing protein 4 n=1 Tax=Sitophilus oryzae TaxID=7048 RepID=A0A6J2XYX1_SITOR|nr:LYR motif-containing protein 4 [Sitophilus oryzae]